MAPHPPLYIASLLFDPSEPQHIGKTHRFATFLPFRPHFLSSFYLLSLLWVFPGLLMHLSISRKFDFWNLLNQLRSPKQIDESIFSQSDSHDIFHVFQAILNIPIWMSYNIWFMFMIFAWIISPYDFHPFPVPTLLKQGLVTVPFWVYWTSPKKVAIWLTITTIHGWVMWKMGTSVMTHEL